MGGLSRSLAKISHHQGDEHRSKFTSGRRGHSKDGILRGSGRSALPRTTTGNRRALPEPVKSAYGVPSGRLLTEPVRLLVLAAAGLGGEAAESASVPGYALQL
jgi:hypothetical protein